MSQKKSQNSRTQRFVDFIKKLLSPFLHEESLRNLEVGSFVNILYPIALSLILAFLIHQIAEVSWPDNFLILIARILVTSLMILYVLFDWDDCHYAARNKEKNTAHDRILWLLAIFWLSLVTVLFLSFSTTEELTWVLVLWLAYAVVTSSIRDSLIEREIKETAEGKENYQKLTQTQKYGEYKAYLRTSIILWVVILVVLILCKKTPLPKWIGEKISWEPSPKAVEFLSSIKCCIIYLCFIGTVLLAVWLKEKRKEILFLKDDNTPQAKEPDA